MTKVKKQGAIQFQTVSDLSHAKFAIERLQHLVPKSETWKQVWGSYAQPSSIQDILDRAMRGVITIECLQEACKRGGVWEFDKRGYIKAPDDNGCNCPYCTGESDDDDEDDE